MAECAAICAVQCGAQLVSAGCWSGAGGGCCFWVLDGACFEAWGQAAGIHLAFHGERGCACAYARAGMCLNARACACVQVQRHTCSTGGFAVISVPPVTLIPLLCVNLECSAFCMFTLIQTCHAHGRHTPSVTTPRPSPIHVCHPPRGAVPVTLVISYLLLAVDEVRAIGPVAQLVLCNYVSPCML